MTGETEVIQAELKAVKIDKTEIMKSVGKIKKSRGKRDAQLEKLQDEFRELEALNIKIFEDRKNKKKRHKTLEKRLESDQKKLKKLATEPNSLKVSVC